MEHRLATRRPANVEVSVEIGRALLATGRIRNVSLTGVFVEMQTDGVHSDAPVRLTFATGGSRDSRHCRWSGYVVRSVDDGIGAMFESDDREDEAGLRALLEMAEAAASVASREST